MIDRELKVRDDPAEQPSRGEIAILMVITAIIATGILLLMSLFGVQQ
jgi:hypothetical protein